MMKPIVAVLPRRKNASPSLRPPSPRTTTNQLRNSIGGSISLSKRHGGHDVWHLQPANAALKAKIVKTHKKNTSPQLDDQFLLNQSADFDAADIEVDHINNIYDPAAQNMLHDFVEAQKHKEFETSSAIPSTFSDEQEEQSDCTSNDASNVIDVSEQGSAKGSDDLMTVQFPDPSSLNAADIPLFLNQMNKYIDVLKLEMDKKGTSNGASKSLQTSPVANNENNYLGTRVPEQVIIITMKPNMPTRPVNIEKKTFNNTNRPRNSTGPIVSSNVRHGAVHPNEKMFFTGNEGTSATLSSSPSANSHWASLANAKSKSNGNSNDAASSKNYTIQMVAPRVKKVSDFGSVDSLSEEYSVGGCNVLCLSKASAFDDRSVGSSSSTSTIRSSQSKNSVKPP